MKKILLSLMLSLFMTMAFSQNFPCVASYSGNNGGGKCGDATCGAVTGKPTGTITLAFEAPITEAPTIEKIFCTGTKCRTQAELDEMCFVLWSVAADGLSAEYCYYLGGANINNLFGGNVLYEFLLMYPGAAIPGCGEEIPLPVKLKSFSASRNNADVDLKWTTLTEQNNQGFQLQRLTGAGGWQNISFVNSKATDGNSVGELHYALSDINPSSVITQYRLMQVDLDSRFKYSDIRAVQGIGQGGRTIISPNPSNNGQVNVVFATTGERRNLQLTDMVGRLVKQWNGYADNSLQLTGLQNGIYQLRIVNAETGLQSIEKIVVSGK